MKEAKLLEVKREDIGDNEYFVAYVLVNRGNLVGDSYEVLRVPFKNHLPNDTNDPLAYQTKP